MIKQKKGKAIVWILIILALIAVGIGIYFLVSFGGANDIIGGAGNSIPSPPALPS